ncbi:hypothetical protein Hdeb2414_s0022g00613631 [Helianthus debilis subsp. tardiflorus]
MVSCLNRKKTAWHGGDDAFREPMLLLAIVYGIVIKKIPSSHSSNIVELVDDDLLNNLERDMESMHAEQHKKTKTREEKKTKRAEEVECGEKPIKKQKQTRKKDIEKAKLIDEGTEEIEDDDAHLGIYRHCADYFLSQNDTQTCALFIGADGECRIPMVSQYGNTPSPSGTSDGDFELGDDVEKGNKNVEAEEGDVAEAAEPIDLQKGSVSLVRDNTPANEQNKDRITWHTSPFSPMTLSFVAEVDRVVEKVQSEKTPETRFNVSGIEAVNLSPRLADTVTDEERNDITQPGQRGGSPRPKRTIILPDALR